MGDEIRHLKCCHLYHIHMGVSLSSEWYFPVPENGISTAVYGISTAVYGISTAVYGGNHFLSS
jgi:hypothetical protein